MPDLWLIGAILALPLAWWLGVRLGRAIAGRLPLWAVGPGGFLYDTTTRLGWQQMHPHQGEGVHPWQAPGPTDDCR